MYLYLRSIVYCRSCNIAAILPILRLLGLMFTQAFTLPYQVILQSPMNLSYTWLGFLHFSNRRKHGFHGRPTHYLRAQKLAFSRCYQVFLSHGFQRPLMDQSLLRTCMINIYTMTDGELITMTSTRWRPAVLV